MLRTSTPEQLERGQALLRGELKPPVAIAKNAALAANLDAPLFFRYNGRRYIAPPIGYQIGIQLQEILLEFERLGGQDDTPESLAHLTRLCAAAVELFPALCAPVNPVVRALWRFGWLRNPFLSATSKEIAQLLGFFAQCQMSSRVQLMGSSAHRLALSSLMPPTN